MPDSLASCFAYTVLLVLAGWINSASGAKPSWPQFRGPGARGVAENPKMPDQWSATKNVAWETDIPGRGWSSPVVWGDRIYLTTAVNQGESEALKKGLYMGGERATPPKAEHEWSVHCLDVAIGQGRASTPDSRSSTC